MGVGISGGIPLGGPQIEQEFTMDFVDALHDLLVWQAITVGKIRESATPEQKETYYVELIGKLLNEYPPK